MQLKGSTVRKTEENKTKVYISDNQKITNTGVCPGCCFQLQAVPSRHSVGYDGAIYQERLFAPLAEEAPRGLPPVGVLAWMD